jgi:TonB family protein
MKFILPLLFSATMLCVSQDLKKDSSTIFSDDSLNIIEHFQPEPKVLFKPAIITPKQLLSIKEKVRVIIKMELDTTGKSSNYKIIKSSNPKFNKIAVRYAKLYKFEYPHLDKIRVKLWITVPIIFNE